MNPTLSTEAAAEFALAAWVEKPGLTFPVFGFVEWRTLTLARARQLHAAGVRALVKLEPGADTVRRPARKRKQKPK